MQDEPRHEVLFSGDLKELMLISHIVLSNNLVTDRFVRERFDMPVHAWSSLYAIHLFPGLRAKHIADLFPRPQNTISRAISLLEKRQLIRSTVADSDAREKALFITRAGNELLQSQISSIQKRQEEMLSPLTAAERDTLVQILHKVACQAALRVSVPMALDGK